MIRRIVSAGAEWVVGVGMCGVYVDRFMLTSLFFVLHLHPTLLVVLAPIPVVVTRTIGTGIPNGHELLETTLAQCFIVVVGENSIEVPKHVTVATNPPAIKGEVFFGCSTLASTIGVRAGELLGTGFGFRHDGVRVGMCANLH